MGISKSGTFNMLLGALCLALMGGVTKVLGRTYPSVELIFFRNLIGTVIMVSAILHRPLEQKGGKFGMLVFRGFIGTFALFAFFYCITKMQLALANTYNLTYPIFIGLITVVILKRKLLRIQWMGILLGFAGVLFIFRPDLHFPLKLHIIGLLSGLGTAIGYITINYLSAYYDRRIIVLSFLLTGLIASIASMLTGMFYQNPELDFILAPFIMPKSLEWLLFLALGTIAVLGQIFITRAFSFGKPAKVGPINYMQIPFTLFIGTFLGDYFTAHAYIGIALIIASGILIIFFSGIRSDISTESESVA